MDSAVPRLLGGLQKALRAVEGDLERRRKAPAGGASPLLVTLEEDGSGFGMHAKELVAAIEQSLVHRINTEDFRGVVPLWALLERVERDEGGSADGHALRNSAAAIAVTSNLQTPVAKVRAWVRQILNTSTAEPAVRVLLKDEHAKLVRVFYAEGAFLRDPLARATLLGVLGHLDGSIRFALAIETDRAELNAAPFWPLLRETAAPRTGSLAGSGRAADGSDPQRGRRASPPRTRPPPAGGALFDRIKVGLDAAIDDVASQVDRALFAEQAPAREALRRASTGDTFQKLNAALVGSLFGGAAANAPAAAGRRDSNGRGRESRQPWEAAPLRSALLDAQQCAFAHLDPALGVPDAAQALLSVLTGAARTRGVLRREVAPPAVAALSERLGRLLAARASDGDAAADALAAGGRRRWEAVLAAQRRPEAVHLPPQVIRSGATLADEGRAPLWGVEGIAPADAGEAAAAQDEAVAPLVLQIAAFRSEGGGGGALAGEEGGAKDNGKDEVGAKDKAEDKAKEKAEDAAEEEEEAEGPRAAGMKGPKAGPAAPEACVHAAGALLLRYLRGLPQPLLTYERFGAFLSVAEIADAAARTRNAQLLASGLPWEHKPLLVAVVDAAAALLRHSDANGLTPAAAALRLGPALLRPPAPRGADDDADLGVAARVARCVELLLAEHGAWLAGVRDELRRRRRALVEKAALLESYAHDLRAALAAGDASHLALLQHLRDALAPVQDGILQRRAAAAPPGAPPAAADAAPTAAEPPRSGAGGADAPGSVMEAEASPEAALRDLLRDPAWRACGLASAAGDALGELRGGGALAPRCLLYFLRAERRHAARELLAAFAGGGGGGGEPSAGAAAVGVLRVACGVIGAAAAPAAPEAEVALRRLSRSSAWAILDHPYALEELFCIGMFLLGDARGACGAAAPGTLGTPGGAPAFGEALLAVKKSLRGLVESQAPSRPSIQRCWRLFRGLRGARGPLPGSAAQCEAPAPRGDARGRAGERRRRRHRSDVFKAEEMAELERALAGGGRGGEWALLYSSARDGTGLRELYERCAGHRRAVLAVRDGGGAVFGGFATEAFEDRGEMFYGSARSFLFSFAGGALRTFGSTGANGFFQLSSAASLAMGGGGDFGLVLDEDLQGGATGPCETFGNGAPLTAREGAGESATFRCAHVEVWAVAGADLPDRA